MKLKPPSFLQNALLVGVILTTLLLIARIAPLAAQSNDATATPPSSTYTVRAGDGWGIIAERFKTTITELKRLNPQAVRFGDILQLGEQLVVPFQTPVPVAAEYVVQPGDGWGMIAARFGVPMSDLMNANPQYLRPGLILRTGDRLVVPAVGAAASVATETASAPSSNNAAAGQATIPANQAILTPASTDAATATATTIPPQTPTETDTALPTETATEVPTEVVADTPTTEAATSESVPAAEEVITDSEEITATEAITSATIISAAVATVEAVAGCPTTFGDYADSIVAKANEADGLTGLQSYLTECGALRVDSFISQDWTGDGLPDLAVIYDNPIPSGVITESELLILNSSADGYTAGYQAHPAGSVQLLATFDVNTDGQSDIVWSDTTCGASTCFVTVNLQSWDGSAWQPWIAKNITLPEALVTLEDRSPDGLGLEIVLDGGTYGSVGAGPQRGRVETWGSIEGQPYTQLGVLYNASPCLYHVVLDGNEAYVKASEIGYEQAEQLYEKAFSDITLTPCWTRVNEDEELRSFSLFRLALVAAQTGRTEEAIDLIQSLTELYPNSPVTPAANVWLTTLNSTGNMVGACATSNEYVAQNPQIIDILADYGYANPTFSASDFCPQPSIAEIEASTTATIIEPSAIDASATASETVTDTSTITATTPISDSADSTTEISQVAPCPTDLGDFADALPAVLTLADGDSAVVLDYLKGCKAANEQNGDVAMGDFNADEIDDVIVLPSIVADLGFGPNGTQGAVLVYHGVGDGTYRLAHNPEIYGSTDLLATEDLNDNDRVDLAWTVTGCGAACLTETQIVSWNAETSEYESIIQPGALIAEGKVELSPVPPADPGKGRQLVLSGGVSTLPDSGLPVPHTEIWESVDGTPFQRIRWVYDRKAIGNDCLGLRLVEAEMALQAVNVLSYTAAIDLYQAAIEDEDLKACSIHELEADTELALLQGLGRFRLIQALALSGNSEGAELALVALDKSQANQEYKKIAADWLESYQTSAEPGTACATVQPVFSAKQELWQISDHFGFNHPVIGEEKSCFMPPVSE